MKPLRRWVKKHQYNTPDWDMPVHTALVNQQSSEPSMHQPYYPQQVRQLLSEHDSSQPSGGSPVHNNRQPQQQPARTPQPSDHLAQMLRNAGINSPGKTPKAVTAAKPAPAAMHSVQGPLAALFNAAAATAGSTDTAKGRKQFCFDKQAIMRALI